MVKEKEFDFIIFCKNKSKFETDNSKVIMDIEIYDALSIKIE